MARPKLALVFVFALAACSEDLPPGDGPCGDAPCDASVADTSDAGDRDAARDDGVDTREDVARDDGVDAGADAGIDATDAGFDAGIDAPVDTGTDAGIDAPVDTGTAAGIDARVDTGTDSGTDARVDTGTDTGRDTGADARVDTGVDVRVDTGVDVPPTGGCISGAVGTHVARFRWTGTTSGSRASVSYEANTLPDRSRWRVTAASRSFGYTPVFTDIFLGEGGLELSGTVFMDVELSTAGLGRISNVTLALYGRSFNTTASGSFAWRTFEGTGSSGLVANSAPYRWYRADATAAFSAGNRGVLLRITPGPPSGALVVNRVEVCFDAR